MAESRKRDKPYYPLQNVKEKIAQGQYRINHNAVKSAFQDFGWKEADIKHVYRKLQDKHYHQTDKSKTIPGIMLDVYYVENINGEDVYTHFYINDDRLIINSFHQLSIFEKE
jgi:hypothetical protein